jgi:hypothetical protein
MLMVWRAMNGTSLYASVYCEKRRVARDLEALSDLPCDGGFSLGSVFFRHGYCKRRRDSLAHGTSEVTERLAKERNYLNFGQSSVTHDLSLQE